MEKNETITLRSIRQGKAGRTDADGRIRDLSEIVPDLAGESLQPESMRRLRNTDIKSLPEIEGKPRIGPCVAESGSLSASA